MKTESVFKTSAGRAVEHETAMIGATLAGVEMMVQHAAAVERLSPGVARAMSQNLDAAQERLRRIEATVAELEKLCLGSIDAEMTLRAINGDLRGTIAVLQGGAVAVRPCVVQPTERPGNHQDTKDTKNNGGDGTNGIGDILKERSNG